MMGAQTELGQWVLRKPGSPDKVSVRTQSQATDLTGTMELLTANVSARGHLPGANLSHASLP
jgi:hypothetical protein